MPNHKPMTDNIRKYKHGLREKQRPARKHRLNCANKLRRRNYNNITKIRRMIEKPNGLQSDPADSVINFSNKHFTKNVYKLLNKNLDFVPTIKKFNEKLLDEEIDNFYRLIKLKAHYRDNTEVKETEE